VELVRAAKKAVAPHLGECEEELIRAAAGLGIGVEELRSLIASLAESSEEAVLKLVELQKGLEGLWALRSRLGFVEKDGVLYIGGSFGVNKYVETGVEKAVAEAVVKNSVAVLHGPRGVGKSAAASKALLDLFLRDYVPLFGRLDESIILHAVRPRQSI